MVHSYCHVFSSIFSEGVDVYTTTFPQMLSKCLIGVATLLICFAVSYDQQHFLNEKELNRQIDQQKGYYHALTEQVLAEREATFAREPRNPGYSRERASARALLAETLVMAGHDAEGCSSYSRALAEWQEIGRKSGGFDSLIQSNDVDPIAKAVADCRTRGIAIR